MLTFVSAAGSIASVAALVGGWLSWSRKRTNGVSIASRVIKNDGSIVGERVTIQSENLQNTGHIGEPPPG